MVNILDRNTQGVKWSFKPPQIFKFKNFFEKIYYKCILLCIFVCFKFSFETSEILKIFFPKWNFFLVNIFSMLVQLYEQKFIPEFNPLSVEDEATNFYITLLKKNRVFTLGYKKEGKETIKVKSYKLKYFLKKLREFVLKKCTYYLLSLLQHIQ